MYRELFHHIETFIWVPHLVAAGKKERKFGYFNQIISKKYDVLWYIIRNVLTEIRSNKITSQN